MFHEPPKVAKEHSTRFQPSVGFAAMFMFCDITVCSTANPLTSVLELNAVVQFMFCCCYTCDI